MERLKAYRIFELEIKELRKFIYSTRFAFNKVGALKNFINDKEHRRYLDDNGFDTKPSGVCSFKKSSIISLERTLNQQTMIRVISALEVFLVDIFKDIFIITKIPFKDQSKVLQYNQSQLLSFRSISELYNQIINKECRSLSSGGFTEIIKAYKSKLNIDLLHIPPGKQKMIEYHEIRHLIVHKLGRIDSQFRKKYNIKNKAGISIDDDYLTNCIKDINGFAKQTHDLVLNRINELITLNIQQAPFERQVKYNIEILEPDSNLDFLNTDFEFWVNDEFEVLRNILVDKKALSENEYELILAGANRQIKAYYSYLKYAKKKQTINLRIIENICETNSDIESGKKRKRKPIYIEEDTLESIRQQLPEQPWETGIHKKVAEKLGLKNKIITTAIQVLIYRGIFKQQINGILIENKNTKPNKGS
ncbi:MAG: hypothetical protein KAT33_02925 [Bacteroidales bacterium]|nr:hypothetical protein [Bacteroidales bacterium]MCK4638351.1 hypothetical protein [Bacteroidales bacterium]